MALAINSENFDSIMKSDQLVVIVFGHNGAVLAEH
jgi:hypothetical protein